MKWTRQIRKELQLEGSRPIDFSTGTAKWVERMATRNKPGLWSEWGLNSGSLDFKTLQRARGPQYCNICFNFPLICVAASYTKSPRYTLVSSEIASTFTSIQNEDSNMFFEVNFHFYWLCTLPNLSSVAFFCPPSSISGLLRDWVLYFPLDFKLQSLCTSHFSHCLFLQPFFPSPYMIFLSLSLSVENDFSVCRIYDWPLLTTNWKKH